MKYLKLFNESNFQVPSVDDVKTVFTNIIQDFVDNQKSDFKFSLKCNEWWGAVDPDADIKWVIFYIKSDTKFKTEDIYPLIERLFNWSKENGANLDKIELISKYNGMVIKPEDKYIKIYENGSWNITFVTLEERRNPDNLFDVEGIKRWAYEKSFMWKK